MRLCLHVHIRARLHFDNKYFVFEAGGVVVGWIVMILAFTEVLKHVESGTRVHFIYLGLKNFGLKIFGVELALDP